MLECTACYEDEVLKGRITAMKSEPEVNDCSSNFGLRLPTSLHHPPAAMMFMEPVDKIEKEIHPTFKEVFYTVRKI
jgi:hypothetical protein